MSRIYDPKYRKEAVPEARKSLLEMPSATSRGLLKIPGWIPDIPALGLHYLSTGLSSMLPEEANQALGIRGFQKDILKPFGGAEWIGSQLDKAPAFFPKPETPVGVATEFLAEIAPVAIEAIPGALAQRFTKEFAPYLAKKISDIKAGLVRPDELSPFEALLLSDPRLNTAIVSGYSTGPSALFGKRQLEGGRVKTDPQATFLDTRGNVVTREGGVLDESGKTLSLLEDQPAEYNQPVFVSEARENADRLVQNLSKKPVPASQLKQGLLNQLPIRAKDPITGKDETIGTKKELEDIGLFKYLDQKGEELTSRDEIKSYLDDFYEGLELTEYAFGKAPVFTQRTERLAPTRSEYQGFGDWWESFGDDVEETWTDNQWGGHREFHHNIHDFDNEDFFNEFNIDQSDVDVSLEWRGDIDFDNEEAVADLHSSIEFLGLDADDIIDDAKAGRYITVNDSRDGGSGLAEELEMLGFEETDRNENWWVEASDELERHGITGNDQTSFLEGGTTISRITDGYGDDVGEDWSVDEVHLGDRLTEYHADEIDDDRAYVDWEQEAEDQGYDREEWEGTAREIEQLELPTLEGHAGERVPLPDDPVEEVVYQETTEPGDPLYTPDDSDLFLADPEDPTPGGGIRGGTRHASHTIGQPNTNYRELVFSLGENSLTPEFRRYSLNLARKYDVPLDDPLFQEAFVRADADNRVLPPRITRNATPQEIETWNKLKDDNRMKVNYMRSKRGTFGHAFSFRDRSNLQPFWVRMSDKIDQNGNRVLFIEEVQSDWFQGLKSAGERLSKEGLEFVDIEIDRLNKALEDYDELVQIYNQARGKRDDRFEVVNRNGAVVDIFRSEEQAKSAVENDADLLYYFDNYKHPLGDGRAVYMNANDSTGVDHYRGLNLRGNRDADRKYEMAFTPYQMSIIHDLVGSLPTTSRGTGIQNNLLNRILIELNPDSMSPFDQNVDTNFANQNYAKASQLVTRIIKNMKESSGAGSAMNKAPFSNIIGKDNRWIKQAVKRMLRWGADNNYDRVAWVTPEDIQSQWVGSRNVKEIDATFDTAQDYGLGQANTRPSIGLMIYKGRQDSQINPSLPTSSPTDTAYVDPFTGYLIKQNLQGQPFSTNQTTFENRHILDYTDAETWGDIQSDYFKHIDAVRDTPAPARYDVKTYKSTDEKQLFWGLPLSNAETPGGIYKHIYGREMPQYTKKLAKRLGVDFGKTRINRAGVVRRKPTVTASEAIDKGLIQDKMVNDILQMQSKKERQDFVDYYDFASDESSSRAFYIDLKNDKNVAKRRIKKGLGLLTD